MVVYKCEYCNYGSPYASSYKTHINTKKHLNKIKDIPFYKECENYTQYLLKTNKITKNTKEINQINTETNIKEQIKPTMKQLENKVKEQELEINELKKTIKANEFLIQLLKDDIVERRKKEKELENTRTINNNHNIVIYYINKCNDPTHFQKLMQSFSDPNGFTNKIEDDAFVVIDSNVDPSTFICNGDLESSGIVYKPES